MPGQVAGVEPGFSAVGSVGQAEEARDVAVALPRAGQQHYAGAAGQGELAAGDGADAETARLPGEVQGPAEVGIGQGQGIRAVLRGLGQQFVDVGNSEAEGVEALGVKLNVILG